MSLRIRIGLLMSALTLAGAWIAAHFVHTGHSVASSVSITLGILVLPALLGLHFSFGPLRRLLRGLAIAVANYREGDLSVGFAVRGNDELAQLFAACNELGHAVREQHAHLVQRELLLDAAAQNSPLALLLVDAGDRIVYENLAARRLFDAGRSLKGRPFAAVIATLPPSLVQATTTSGDSLLSAQIDGADEIYHLSQRRFLLQGRTHRLYLFKRLTREIARQEVATWKKLIRVLSHEVNNSLAPIASMADSARQLLERGEAGSLPPLLHSIGDRAGHLHKFITAYAAISRLPDPHPEAIAWTELTRSLMQHHPCRIAEPLPAEHGWFDRHQVEQALINLLRNAHEAGGRIEDVELAVTQGAHEQRIAIRDRGSGMSDTVLAQALLPFYSTKRTGTGLGLALAREIAEAHVGSLHIANRDGGGLSVELRMPMPDLPQPFDPK